MLAASAMEGSRTTLDETVMPPPSTPRGVKRKTMDKEATLPVRAGPVYLPQSTRSQISFWSLCLVPEPSSCITPVKLLGMRVCMQY